MVTSPRKSKAATKGGKASPAKTADKHKKEKAVLKRTHTIAEAAKEGRAFVRSQNCKTSPAKKRRRVKRPAPVKPSSPTKVDSPRPTASPKASASPKAATKRAQPKSKVPKKHAKVASPRIGRTKTMQETLAAANAFLGKPNEPEKKAEPAPAPAKNAKAKPKLARKSTIQQTIGAAKGFLKKSRRGKK